ncbi:MULTISPECIES: nucleotidyltransferase family protein [Modicisalibacter]|uniref:nucleotidyltransferase family protein n=1 Tax=Modicisalibacter TaxID=574347 RepID=UPI00100C0A44|nr:MULTISPECIES: nucleotidyltransferase family protein [Halomonadaceae]MBZ9559152.1 nucleotidyltransferase family protein [Modicisalibacter sp. R2A 31.J]MBZ9576683.1 nucleotidyltransferase family protein [Modicisalibacter sp. MOD 31.J]
MPSEPNAASRAVAALVLAAGQSRRFGSDKRVAPLPGRGTLLAATLATLRPYFPELRVVIGPDDDPASLGVPADVITLVNPEAPRGMGNTLAVGMQAMQRDSRAQAVAVMLGDMPWVRAATFEALIGEARADRIVRPTFQGVGGHPVVFGRHFWPALSRLDGDDGARRLLREHPQACIEVPVGDAGILKDLDEPDALAPS